jgi:hypothetical protein
MAERTALGGTVILGDGLPEPPAGYAYLVDAGGRYFVNRDARQKRSHGLSCGLYITCSVGPLRPTYLAVSFDR